jgi:hypothetical protein
MPKAISKIMSWCDCRATTNTSQRDEKSFYLPDAPVKDDFAIAELLDV